MNNDTMSSVKFNCLGRVNLDQLKLDAIRRRVKEKNFVTLRNESKKMSLDERKKMYLKLIKRENQQRELLLKQQNDKKVVFLP
jgi:hypothetical protein